MILTHKYQKHTFNEEIRLQQGLSYILLCIHPLRILYNSKFILMATSLGTNTVVVTRIHCIGVLEVRMKRLVWALCSFPIDRSSVFMRRFIVCSSSLLHLVFFFFFFFFFCISGFTKYAQRRFRSDCANAQSDLNLRWEHMSEVTFSDVAAHYFICSFCYFFFLCI